MTAAEKAFAALLREGSLAGYMVTTGVNLLHESATSPTGVFSAALFNLSVGIERLGKLVVVLDCLETGGAFLTDGELKHRYGHDIDSLFKAAADIVTKRQLKFEFGGVPDDPIHQGILRVLTGFATTTRYYNLNFLGSKGKTAHSSPEEAWAQLVAEPILARHYSKKQQKRDVSDALNVTKSLSGVMIVNKFTREGEHLTTVYDAYIYGAKAGVIFDFAQFYTLQIIRFFVQMLAELEGGDERVPFFSEVLRVYYNNDDLLRETKHWELL
jgi:hypothetical protein